MKMKQHGVALITVLVIVAIVAGVGATAMFDQQIVVRRAENLLHGNQAILHLLSLETWAKEILIEDREDGESVDDLTENWAKNLLPVEADGGTVAGNILDLQGRFNLNSLIDANGELRESAQWQYRCLLEKRVVDLLDIDRVVAATIDWMDRDQDSVNGAEDLDYLSRDPAYRTSSRSMVSPTELLLIEGMTYEAWEKLRDIVTALPKSATTINVNTAGVEVLECLHRLMDEGLAQNIVSTRESDGGFESWNAFVEYLRGELGDEGNSIDQKAWNADVKSEYFLVNTYAHFGDIELRMYHVLERGADAAGPIRLVMRSFSEEW